MDNLSVPGVVGNPPVPQQMLKEPPGGPEHEIGPGDTGGGDDAEDAQDNVMLTDNGVEKDGWASDSGTPLMGRSHHRRFRDLHRVMSQSPEVKQRRAEERRRGAEAEAEMNRTAEDEKRKRGLSLRAALTIGHGGEGSVVLPILHCCCEQICVYDRRQRRWCCQGRLPQLFYDDRVKRWKWENIAVVSYLLSLLAMGLLGWQILNAQAEPFATWVRDPYVSWSLACMLYVALATGTFVPVAYAFLKPADYSKIETAGDSEKWLIENILRRRLMDNFAVVDLSLPENRENKILGQLEFSLEELKALSSQYASDLLAVRKGMEGALATWCKWVRQYRLFNNYYTVVMVVTSIGIPLLSQLVSCEGTSQLFLTIVSSHSGLMLALEKALKCQEKFRSYRTAESLALDAWRRMVHTPWMMASGDSGENFLELIKEEFTAFVETMEGVRDFARKIETYSGGDKDVDSKDDHRKGGSVDQAARRKGSNVVGRGHSGNNRQYSMVPPTAERAQSRAQTAPPRGQ